MSFAVAILTFNHPNISIDCIQSVKSVVADSKIFVIHNGSLPEHILKVRNQFPELAHLIEENNKGFTGGCNFTFRELFKTHEWIYFLTNDITLLSLGALPSLPGLYAPRIWRRKIGVMDSIGGAFIPSEQKLYHLKNPEELTNLEAGHLPYVPGTAFLLHRDIFLKVGGMDESLHTYWEDVDFSQRVRLAGLKIDSILNFELIHKVGKTCHKDPFYTNHLFKRNREIISKRYNDKF
jgi:GT2 family glycosyltransferase